MSPELCVRFKSAGRRRGGGGSLPGFDPYRLTHPRMSRSTEEAPMLSEAEIATRVEDWLAQFETALQKPRGDPLAALFHGNSYWRDVLALTWHIVTVNGADTIGAELKARWHRVQPRGFHIDPHRDD
jgi:hypothetical protein